jgi:hypothetical protein
MQVIAVLKFEFTIESSKLIIIFVLLQHGWGEDWVSTHQDSTVHLASIFNAAIIRPRRFWLAVLVRYSTWKKQWFSGWFVQDQTWYTQILSKNRLHAATTSSLDSSTHRPRRFSLAFFVRKAIGLIFGMIRTGSDFIYLGIIQESSPRCHDIIIQVWFVNVSSPQVLACFFYSKSDLDK